MIPSLRFKTDCLKTKCGILLHMLNNNIYNVPGAENSAQKLEGMSCGLAISYKVF